LQTDIADITENVRIFMLNAVIVECKMGWSGRRKPVPETKGKCFDICYWHIPGSA